MTGFISSQSRRVEAQEQSVGRFGFRGPFLSSQMATISASKHGLPAVCPHPWGILPFRKDTSHTERGRQPRALV